METVSCCLNFVAGLLGSSSKLPFSGHVWEQCGLLLANIFNSLIGSYITSHPHHCYLLYNEVVDRTHRCSGDIEMIYLCIYYIPIENSVIRTRVIFYHIG